GRLLGRPVDGQRIDLVALGIEDMDVVLGQVVRVLADERDDVAPHYRFGRVPVRIDNDLVDPGTQERRLTIDLADHSRVAQRDAAVLDRLDLGGGDVDHHETLAEVSCGQLAQAHQVRLQLLQADIGADVHRGKGVTAGHTVGRQTVARLEALERCLHVRIEGRADTCAGGEVTGNHQPAAQHLYVGVDDAELQPPGGGNHGPA